MSILTCNGISLSYGTDVILDNITFSINKGCKLGVIGVNGAGKSTLLRIISEEIEADNGTVSVAKGARLGKLEQYTDSSFSGKTALDVAFERFEDLIKMENELVSLERDMGKGIVGAIDKYTALRDKFKILGGYEYKSKAVSMLKRLGFSDDDLHKDAVKLSGGQKTKLALAALLMSEPDIILLDEPTNHLDINSAIWLEEIIKASPSTFIIVSHDRYFLDKVCTDTLEIENTHCTLYSGGYSLFKDKKKKLLEDAAKHYATQQKEIARLEAFIENQRKWNRERNIIAAESRMKAIDRMVKVDKPENAPSAIKIDIAGVGKSSYDVLSVRGISKRFGDRCLFSELSFELKKQDRLFVIGGNGTGKSTLLKIINGVISADKGVVEFGYNQQPGYYDQEQMLLDNRLDVITELWNAYPNFSQTELRNALARYGFRGDDVFKNVSDLSGGEKARLAIAKLVLSGSSLLILDEPTNYLDISSKEVLEEALSSYEGTLICVSHDRYLVDSLSTKILDIDTCYSNGYRFYPLGYSDYLKNRPTDNAPQEKQKIASNGASDFQQRKKAISEKKREEKRKAFLEKAIEDTEARLEELDKLCSEHSTDYVKLAEIDDERQQLDAKLLEYYDELIELV